ncbi:MAG TPA: DUF4214 domain-containing protein [Aquihabitans sp.]|nr:DUF4214 domain-containing protein [Aquihabitans sp.]
MARATGQRATERRARRALGGIALSVGLLAGSVAAGVGPAVATPAAPATPGRMAGNASVAPAALAPQPISTPYARQILERIRAELAPATEAEVVALGAQLDGGTSGVDAVRGQLLADPWLAARIGDTYERWLGRAADPSGLAHWQAVVRGGRTLEQLEQAFGLSDEAWRSGGSTNAGYVDVVFEALLGRPADPNGKAFWTGRLDRGTTRDSFVRGVIRSNERAVPLVRGAYLAMLGRAADPSGLASKVDQYRHARTWELELLAGLLGSSEARNQGCDPFDGRKCFLPFPNDHFTTTDPGTATGRRIAFKREWLAPNAQGVRPNPQEWNRNDGFSPGQSGLLKVPGIDLDQTGAATLDDIGAYADEDAPIVAIDAETGERQPLFAELDANIPEADRASDQLLYLRPAKNWTAGHRYIFALRNLKRADGSTIPAPDSFARFKTDDGSAFVGDAHDRWVHQQFLFSDLAEAGIGVDDLYLAWDFTVASTENTTGRMLHIRDDALAALDGHAPDFTITSVQENPEAGIVRRVEGTFEVPNYLTGDGSAGNGYHTDPATGLPVRNGSLTARFGCSVPDVEGDGPARPVIYGHGLFGSYGEVFSSPQRTMVKDHDMVYCATDWIGMSEGDIGNAATILQDISTFNTLTDRSQQGILNTIVLGRLMLAPDGFNSDAAFQHPGGAPRIDTTALFYDGNSQGGVIGGAFVAVSPDVRAGVLGVAGMNYSTLLERSVDFDPFGALMKQSYPDAVDRVVGLQFIQMLWDRGETNGYAAHLTEDPLPGSGSKRVLIHVALGDHQVAPFTAEIEARTAGAMDVHRPAYGEGRTLDVDPVWGLDAVADGSTGSALVIWDSGAEVPPLQNVPPRAGEDPHEDPRRSPLAQQQKSDFLEVDGRFTEVCGSEPCTAPPT